MKIKQLYLDFEKLNGQAVEINGWIRNIRVSKNFGFIELTDGSYFKTVQVVFEDGLANFTEISKLNIGAAIRVNGVVAVTPDAKQPFEIKAEAVVIEGESTPDYPMQPKRHTMEFLRTLPHLRPRTNTFSAVFRVRSLIAYAIHKFFNDRGFVYVHTPIITGSDCEGAGEMFRVTTLDMQNVPMVESNCPNGHEGSGNVPGAGSADPNDGLHKIYKAVDYGKDFFGTESSLTVSGQLDVESFAATFGDVYTFGPTFRAENSNTTRHAAEFWMIEPEISFADLNDDMNLAEDMLKFIVSYVLKHAPSEMEFFNNFVDKTLLERLNMIVDSKFARVSYTEAVEILEKCGKKFEYPVKWGMDLQTEHERYLTEEVFKKPVFVTDYPKDIKAFYMRLNDDGKTVAAMDCLVPGVGEIIGGSQREERLDVLLSRIKECGLDENDYQNYIDLRRFGTNKHAGFGLGFERAVMYLTGMGNIRDVIPYPRTVGNLG